MYSRAILLIASLLVKKNIIQNTKDNNNIQANSRTKASYFL